MRWESGLETAVRTGIIKNEKSSQNGIVKPCQIALRSTKWTWRLSIYKVDNINREILSFSKVCGIREQVGLIWNYGLGWGWIKKIKFRWKYGWNGFILDGEGR